MFQFIVLLQNIFILIWFPFIVLLQDSFVVRPDRYVRYFTLRSINWWSGKLFHHFFLHFDHIVHCTFNIQLWKLSFSSKLWMRCGFWGKPHKRQQRLILKIFDFLRYDLMLVSIQLYTYSLTLKGHTLGEPCFEGRGEATKEERPSTKYQCYGVPQHDRWKCYLNVAKFIVGILAL